MKHIRHLIPESIPFYVVSATLPKLVLDDVSDILRLRASRTEYVMRSNDRPEVALAVKTLLHPANSFKDLACLLPGDPLCVRQPPRFIVYFDNTKEAEAAAKFLQTRLRPEDKHRVAYCHATMTSNYRQDELDAFQKGERWGVTSTDTFGLGVNVPAVEIVAQMRATCTMDALFQRFGRAARGLGENGIGVLFVDKKDTDGYRELQTEKKRKRAERGKRGKRKAVTQHPGVTKHPAKRVALCDIAGPNDVPRHAHAGDNDEHDNAEELESSSEELDEGERDRSDGENEGRDI